MRNYIYSSIFVLFFVCISLVDGAFSADLSLRGASGYGEEAGQVKRNLLSDITEIKKLIVKKDYQKVIAKIESVIHDDTLSTDQLAGLYAQRASAYVRTDQYKLAEVDFSNALWLGGLSKTTRSEILAARADVLIKSKKYSQARKDINEALKLDKKNPLAFFVAGQLEIKKNKPSKALKLLNKAEKYGYKDYNSLNLIKAVAWYQYGDKRTAVQLLREVLYRKPHHPAAIKIAIGIDEAEDKKNKKDRKANIQQYVQPPQLLLPIDIFIEERQKIARKENNADQKDNIRVSYPHDNHDEDIVTGSYFPSWQTCEQSQYIKNGGELNKKYNKKLNNDSNKILYREYEKHDDKQNQYPLPEEINMNNDIENQCNEVFADDIGDGVLEYQPNESDKNIAYEWDKVTSLTYDNPNGLDYELSSQKKLPNQSYRLRRIGLKNNNEKLKDAIARVKIGSYDSKYQAQLASEDAKKNIGYLFFDKKFLILPDEIGQDNIKYDLLIGDYKLSQSANDKCIQLRKTGVNCSVVAN